jgi:SAM-dependent methyltransferase
MDAQRAAETCSMCGSSDYDWVAPRAWDAKYLQCNSCGHQREVVSIFHDHNEPYYEDDSYFYFSPFSQWLSKSVAKQRVAELRRYVRRGHVLEIGPGSGHVLLAAQEAGFTVSAVENSRAFVKRLQAITRANVYHGFFDEVDFADLSFAAVLSFHVIEHLKDPVGHLKRVLNVAERGGYLFLATLNAASWDRSFCKDKWTGYSVGHVNLFSANSLRLCLEMSGWEVVRMSTVEFPWQMLWSLKVSVKPKKVTAETAGSNVKKIPVGVGAAALTAFGALTKPFRMIQQLANGGNELFVVARRPGQSHSS